MDINNIRSFKEYVLSGQKLFEDDNSFDYEGLKIICKNATDKASFEKFLGTLDKNDQNKVLNAIKEARDKKEDTLNIDSLFNTEKDEDSDDKEEPETVPGDKHDDEEEKVEEPVDEPEPEEKKNDTKFYGRSMSINPTGSTSEDKIKDLRAKYNILRTTTDNLTNMFKNSVNQGDTFKKCLNMFGGKSLQEIKNKADNFLENDLKKINQDNYTNKTRVEVANNQRGLFTKNKNTPEAIKDAKGEPAVDFDNDNLDEGIGDILANAKRKLQSNTSLMYDNNKYSTGRVVSTLNNAKKLGKDIFKVGVQQFDAIYNDHLARCEQILSNNIKEINSYLDKAQKKLSDWENGDTYVGDEDVYISNITTSLASAFSKMKATASMISPIIADYENGVNSIIRDINVKSDRIKSSANTHDVRTAINKADIRLHQKEEAKKARENFGAESKKNTGLNDRQREMFFNALSRNDGKDNSTIENFTVDKIIQSVGILKNNQYATIEGLTPNNNVNLRILWAAYVYKKLGMEQKLQDKYGIGEEFDKALNSWLLKVWDEIRGYSNGLLINDIEAVQSGKPSVVDEKRKTAKEEAKNNNLLNKAKEKFGLKKKGTKINPDAVQKLNDNLTGEKEADNEKRATGAAKDFDGEEPKTIFDYAVMKAKKLQ